MLTILGVLVLYLLVCVICKTMGVAAKTMYWLCVKFPIALMLMVFGVTMCITVIFYPLGKWMVKQGGKMLAG